MATSLKNLLVNGKNKITARTNALSKIQTDMANRTTATNVNSTPNLPTPTVNSTNLNLRKAAQPVQTPIVQDNAMNNLNTKIVQPVQTSTTAGGVGTVAPVPQQSRFIGLQQQPKAKSVADITKSALYIPTAGGAAGKENKKEEQRFRTSEQALLDFQADVLKKKGKMKDADIKRLYPEFADQLDVMKELQTELRPIVKNGQGVDGEQLAQYYPELIQSKNLQDVEAIRKQSEKDNQKLQSNIQKVEKVVTENFDVLSPDGQKYVQDYLTLAGVVNSLKKNYRIVGGANDDEILQYAIKSNPQLKGVADELQNLTLTEMDKATIDGNSQNIITSLISGLQKMTRQANTAVQNFAAEQNYLAEQDGTNQPNFFNTTWNTAANILGAADQATTATARFAGNQNVNYNIGDKEAQKAVEKQEVSDLLAMGGGYWKTIWGIATAPFEYGKLNPITKPVVEKGVEPLFETISDLEKTVTNPVWNVLGFDEQDKENADAILLGEVFREFKTVKKDIKVRADAAKDIVSDAFKRTVKSSKRSEMKNEFQKAGVYDEAGYIKPEAKVQAAKIIAREFGKDFTENFKNNAKQWGDVVDFYRKKEGVKSYKEQAQDLKEGVKNVTNTVKETGKNVGKKIAEGIDKGFDKMDESIETRIDKIRNKVTKKQSTEVKTEETAPIKDTAGWSQPKKGVVSKVVGGVTAVGNKINEKVVDPLSTKVAEGITSTTAPQDKLFKALNPSINVLSRKKGNYDTIRKNADRANELIVEYGDAPTNSKDYYDSIVNTKKKIWNNGVQQGLDEYKYTTIDAKDLINPVREALKEFTAEPLEALKGDVKKLEAELQAIESKGIISLLEMETKKRQINAILEYGLPPDASQIYEKGMRELNRQIGIQEDRMISELPGEFSKFKRDYGALTAIEEDAQKLMIKDMKKKLGGNLIQNWSRIEGLGKMGKAMVGNGSFLEGAAQIILGESLGKVKDTNFLIKSGFEGLRGQYKGGITKPEGVKIKKKPPTPKLEDKRTDIEKGKIAELDMRSDENKKEGYSRKEEKKNVVTKKSAVTEKKPEPKKEEIVEKKETPKAEKELETRVETKQPEPKQEPKNKVTAKNTVVTEENLDELLDGSGIDRTRNANIINNIKSFDDLKDLLKPAKAGAVSDWEYEGELNGVKTRVWNYGDTIFIKYGEGQGPAQARIDMTDKNYIDQLKELLSEINNDGEILESNRSNPFSTNTAATSKKNAVTSKPEGIRTFEQGGKLESSDDLVAKLKSKELGRFQKFEDGKAVLGLVNNFNESVISVADGDWQTAVQAYIMRDDKGEKVHFQLGENTTKESERIFNKILQDLKIGYIVGHKDDRTPTVLYKKTGHTDDMKYGRSFNGVALSKDYRLGDTDFTIQRNAAEQAEYDKRVAENRAENQKWREEQAEKERIKKEEIAKKEQELTEKRKGLQEFLDEQYENNLPKAKAKSELTKLNKDADRNSEIAYYEGFPENYNDMEIWELLDILGNLDNGEIREVREHGDVYSYWYELNRRQNEKGRWTNDYRTHLNKYEKDYLDFVMGKKRVEADLAEEARDMKENPEKYASEEQLKSLFKEGGTTVKTQLENTENLVTDKAKITTKNQETFDGLPVEEDEGGKFVRRSVNGLPPIKQYIGQGDSKPVAKSEGNAFGLKEQKGSSRINNFTNVVKRIIDKYEKDISDNSILIEKEPYLPLEITYNPNKRELVVRHNNLGYDDPSMRFYISNDGKLHVTGIKQAFMEQYMGNWNWSTDIKDTDELLHVRAVNLEDQFLGERNIDEDTGIMKTTTEITGDKNAVTAKTVAKSENQNIIGKNNTLTTNPTTNEPKELGPNNQGPSERVLGSDRPLSMNERNVEGEKDYAGEISRDLRKEQLDNDAISKGQSAGPAIGQQQRILTKSEARTINQNAKEILANHNYSTNPKDYSKEALEILRQYEGAGGLTKVGEDTTGALDQFYTPQAAIDAVWHLVDMYKDESNRYDVLEPTVGTGRFIRDHADENYEGHEIDKVPGTIAQILHPEARIQVGDFEDQFMDFTGRVPQDFGRRVDIVVGNPPYSQRMSKQQKAGLEPKIKRSEEFFIKKGIDILTNGGMLAMVVPSTFLRNPMDYAKEEILKQASLVDAYRLPEGVFPYTQVGTDIIVFKKNKSGSDSIADNKWFEEHPEKVLGEEKERISRFGNLEKYVDGGKNPLEMLNAIYEDKKAVEPTPEMQAKEYSPTKSIESKPVEQKTTTQVTGEKNKVTAKTPVKRTTKPGTKIDKQTIIKGEKTDLIDTVFGEGDVDERLIEYSKKTDINGYVQGPALELVEKDPKNLNFYKYHAVINDLYFAGNIREKLDTLEREKADLSEAQYKKQKEGLLAALPEQYTVENHPYVSPLDTNVMSMETDDTYESYEGYNQTKTKHFTVKDLFLDWFRTNVSYNTMNKRLAQEYINGEAMRSGSSNTYGLTDKEKAAKLRHEKSVVMEQTNELFNEWLWTKLDRKMQEKIIDKFNKENRSYVLPKYDKMPLPLKGISETFMGDKFVPKEAQIEAINFLLSKGAGIAALGVGWGKTIVGTIATREAQLRGWNKRPMIIGPAPTLYAQWVRTIREQYPDWEIVNLGGLTVDDVKRLKRDLGDDPVNWIKDGQVAVISREGLANGIDFKPRTRMELEMDLKDVMEDKSKKAKKTARAEESLKKKIEQWLAPGEGKADKHIYHENAEFLRTTYNRMLDMNKQEFLEYFKDAVKEEYKDLPDNVIEGDAEAIWSNRPIFIEDLGIDHLTVDEMHNFKNVFASAKMDEDENGKKGVNRYSNIIQGSSSERGQKLYLASQYVMKNNGNRNVFGLTATPFNNQPIEIYNMLSMVGKNELEKMGLTNINDFFSKFAEFKEGLAPNAAGTELEYKFVMKDFANKRDLQRLITQFVLFKGDSQDLVRPEYRLRTPVIEMSDEQKLAQAGLEVKALDNADKGDVLSATNGMIGNLVTPFMVKGVRAPTGWKDFIDNSAKLKFIAEAIKNLRDMGNEDGCFIYMPKGVEFHETYREALANITGTPKEKIGIINTNTKARKDEIAQAFRDGRINILIGGKNTAEGIDLQDRGYITFITDVGRNTTERTQVDGRIWRQNNNNSHVLSVVPLLKDSADIIYMGKADQKGSRINNALDMILYGGEGDLSPEEAMTNLMTDPVKKAKSMLNIQKQDIDKEIYGVNTQRDRLKEMRRKIEDGEKSVEQLERRYEQEKLAGRTWNLNGIKQDIKETKKAQEWLEKYLQDNGSVPTKEELEVEIKKLDEEIEKFEEKKKEINEADKNGMLDKLVKDITEEYNRNNSSIKDYNAYLEDLKKDYAEAHRFGSKAELKQYLEDKKNGVLATDKNRVTSGKTMAASARRPSITMKVDDREEKNVVKPTKEVKPQVEQKDIKGKMYHVTTADFENFRESADYDDEDKRDWNDSFGTYVTDNKDFFEGFEATSPRGEKGKEWREIEVDVDIKKAALHPYRTWKEFGVDKADEMIIDWLQLVERFTPEMQKELVALKMYSNESETQEEFDYDSYPFKDSYTKEEILELPGNISSGILDAQFVGEGEPIIDMLFGDDASNDREILKKKGYDAVMIYEGDINGPVYSYALFYPNKYNKRNGATANDKNRVTNNAMRAYRPQITMKVDDNGNPVKKNKITKQPVQNAPMKFSPELVSKIDKLAEERGLEGNTIKKMKVLNKEVDKGKGYQTETEKEIYNLKKQIITEYVKSKGKTINDKGQKKTIVDIKQGKTRVHWHVVGKLYRDLKREGIIK